MRTGIGTKTVALVVDDDETIRELFGELLAAEGIECVLAPDAEQGLECFRRAPTPLVITDLMMSGHDGLWLIKEILHLRPHTAIIATSGYAETRLAIQCLRAGASDFLSKPFRPHELNEAVDRALQRRSRLLSDQRYRVGLEAEVRLKREQLAQALSDLDHAYQATLEALAAALDARERDTGRHSERVMRYTMALAAHMGVRGPLLVEFGRGALLHDIGKIGVSDTILLKPGKLTPDEWQEMRRHPEIGFEIIRDIPALREAAEIILCHQERFDGGGYPAGLAGAEIPLGARIFSVTDAYDAIRSDRPYRKGVSHEEASAELRRCAGTQFDPGVVEAFLELSPELLAALRADDAEISTLLPELTSSWDLSRPEEGEGQPRGLEQESAENAPASA